MEPPVIVNATQQSGTLLSEPEGAQSRIFPLQHIGQVRNPELCV